MNNCYRHEDYAGSECAACALLEANAEAARNAEYLAERLEDARRRTAEDERWARADAEAAAAIRKEDAEERRREDAEAAAERLDAIRQSIEDTAAKKDDYL